MPTNQVYLTDEKYAKMVFAQEQINKGKPLNQQETISQIWQRWIEERLEGCDVPAHLEEKHVLHEGG